MQMTVGDIARRVGAALEGDPDRVVTGVAAVHEAGPGHLAFCARSQYAPLVASSPAAAVLVHRDFGGAAGPALLRVDDPYRAFLAVFRLFARETPERPRGIDPTAVLGPGVELGREVAVGPLCVVEEGARIGDGATLCAGVFVGAGAVLGEGCYLFPNAVVLERVILGRRVIVHAGAVLGSDGFGYAPEGGVHLKIPQIGTVVVEDDVEIGANVTVDRGTLGETRIGKGSKIDNLVHLGHNVVVGENALLVAQVGISGSTRVGRNATVAGQAGVAGHITVGEGATVGAQAGVTKSVPAGARVSGYPAMEHDRARRLNAYYRRLPSLFEDLKRLQDRVRELEREREGVS